MPSSNFFLNLEFFSSFFLVILFVYENSQSLILIKQLRKKKNKE